jgi:chromate transporter
VTDVARSRVSLAELALAFLRLGVTAFGGPAAHVALMEDELVRRRRWLTHERFLDLLGAANLIPGPSSSELAIYIGFERAGWAGLFVAGACFILPAALMAGALAFVYVRFGALPPIGRVLYGVKPIVIAIVVQALWSLAPKAVKSRRLAAVGAAACVAAALGTGAVPVLLGAGGIAALARGPRPKGEGAMGLSWRASALATGAGVATTAAPVGLFSLFLVFLKIGAVVFGSGYVLLAFLRDDLVTRLHWMSEAQLLDAIAVGQVTPGPVFTTATFIGYLLAGARGAVVATLAIFLPGFVLVAATRPLLPRVRRSPTASAFLDGVNVASLALMAVVTVQLARATLLDVPAILVALLGAFFLLRFKMNATWLIAAGAVVGLVVPGH